MFANMLSNRVTILHSGALSAFAQIVYANKFRLRRVWLISPWIGGTTNGTDPISYLVEALRGSDCIVNLVTRKPTAEWHSQAIRVMWENFGPTLYYCPTLHAKLYIAECDGFRCAIFGSPNLTGKADKENHELAIQFRTTVESREDEVAAIITELTAYARDLAAEDDVELIQRP